MRVYDNNIISPATDTAAAAAAYEHSQLLHVMGPLLPSPDAKTISLLLLLFTLTGTTKSGYNTTAVFFHCDVSRM